jgi:hypothetical protein
MRSWNAGGECHGERIVRATRAASDEQHELVVGIDTSTAGAKSGSVLLNLFSNGSGTSDLARTALPSQTVNVSGNVYRSPGASAHAPEPVSFGNFHVGALAPSQALSVTNNVPNDGFSERLDATIGSPTGGVTTNAGSFSLLAPRNDRTARAWLLASIRAAPARRTEQRRSP